jgi:hypothetical protein
LVVDFDSVAAGFASPDFDSDFDSDDPAVSPAGVSEEELPDDFEA